MKYAEANTLRTQQTVAHFGKHARHPLCLAALDLWRVEAELSKWTKAVVLSEETVNSAKRQRGEVLASIEQFRDEQKEKEVNQGCALFREIDELLPKAQKRYQAAVGLRAMYQEFHGMAVTRFNREHDAAIHQWDTKALRALQRTRKRWNNKKEFLGDSDRRAIEILKILRDTVVKQAWAKDGAAAGYWEAVSGGDRALSDEAWQGLLTAREIQSRLVDAPGDRHAKEVRRLVRKLGVRLAKDQRGRKPKPYLPKQKPKRPPGRARTKAELEFTGDINRVLDELLRKRRGMASRQPSKNQLWDSNEARRTAAEKRAKLRDKRRKSS